jgi:serine/threonine-protein kinase
MKRNTPLITLLVGAALGVVLLVASMLATPSNAQPNYSAVAASSAASASSAAPAESSEAPEPAESSAAASAPAAAPSPAPTRTTPTRADFTGRVGGGGGSVAVAVHGDKAIAYVCNGSTVEGWMRGKVENGKLTLTGKNNTHLTASIHTGTVTGDVEAHGTDYSFSVPTVSKSSSKSSGLYQATAVVQGKTIKAGWIVMGDGTQIGSLEINESGENAVTAPKLDVATMTARIGNVVLHAVPVSGVTGSGF